MENYSLSPNLTQTTKLWRYMSLDKFIDILSSKELYFTPISSYSNSDPYEGLLPKVAMDAMAGVLRKTHDEIAHTVEQLQSMLDEVELKSEQSNGPDLTFKHAEFQKLKNLHQSHLGNVERFYFKLLSSVTVNCWHQNDSESEGMWRLYSEENKGIAIQTNVSKLIEAIDTDKYVVFSEVKYIDFSDKSLSPKDCVINGNLTPYLKRKSFAHEHEVRLSITPKLTLAAVGDYVPSGIRVSIDPNTLIEKIYISPYASQPYPNSVYAIAEKFGIAKEKITKSNLLTIDSSLLKLF